MITKINFFRINVAPAANSVFQCTNFADFISNSTLICGHSYIPVISVSQSVVKNLHYLR
jgi:hypothetical protein